MSKEEEDERRLYECVRKYDIIVKQFNELVVMIDARTRAPKRRRVSSDSRGNNVAHAAQSQPENNDVLVQTVTRFLEELRTNPADPSCSTNTDNQN